jgi:hypothetical protein
MVRSMNRETTVAACLIALAVAACGDAFSAVDDAGTSPEPDGSFDASIDTGLTDADGDDAARPRDAATHDGQGGGGDDGGGGGGQGDGGGPPPILDSGGLDAGVLCAKTCPSGFDCVASACVDRAAQRFSALTGTPGNWSYGYSTAEGATFQPDTSRFNPTMALEVWTNSVANSLAPSIFHNSGLAAVTYDEMTVDVGVLGIYAGPAGEVSILRWTAPATGIYDINVTFVGISKPLTTVSVGVLINEATTKNSASSLNMYTNGNSFTYAASAQSLAVGTTVDFYSMMIPNTDDAIGGASLDAHITAD